MEGPQATAEYTGAVDGDTMKGTMRIGEFADWTFTGKRKKEYGTIRVS